MPCDRNPAYASAIRANRRRSSALSSAHGRVKSGAGNGSPPGSVRVSGVPIGFSAGSSVVAGTRPSSFCRARISTRIASCPASKRPR
jgi:hypothetical protein